MSENKAGSKDNITVIRPAKGFFNFRLKEFWAFKDLIFLFAKRDLSVKYRQTILGPIWLVVMPILSSGVSSFVFGDIANIDSGDVPYFVFYFSAFAAWSFFSGCLGSTVSTFTSNAGLFKKVWFPRLVVPVSKIFTELFKFGIYCILLIIVLIVAAAAGADIKPVWSMLWLLPLLVMLMALLALGCGMIFSSLTAKYRDLSALVSTGISLWKYLTPVIYTASSLTGFARYVCLINPMGPIIEAFRYICTGSGGEIYPFYLLLSVAETVIILFIGLVIFSRKEKNFVDVV